MHHFPHVTYVRNITDIDDKIIKRAAEQKMAITEVTDFFIAAMHEDCQALQILAPTHEPRATHYIDAMILLITLLQRKGYAYQDATGDVHFSVKRFENYGRLSGKNIAQLRAGERVSINTAKQDPLDFVLWKSAQPGDPSWPSPWGPGRPGWHIECSCMSQALLGTSFDIHGGGLDLQFPHHENEIAQSEAAYGVPYARYWIHNGFVKVADEKMSKSLGNFITIRDLLGTVDTEALRLFMLRTHYRSPLSYTPEALEEASTALTSLYLTLRPFDEEPPPTIDWEHPHAALFLKAMDHDFSTTEAIATLFDLAKQINKMHAKNDAILLRQLGRTLGFFQRPIEEFLQGHTTNPAQIEQDIHRRQIAKQSGQYAVADQIRQQLADQGIILEDTPQGTIWRRQL